MKKPFQKGVAGKAVGAPKVPMGGPTKLGGGLGGGNASALSQGIAAARPMQKPRVGPIATKQSLMRNPMGIGGGL
jgi:hypothetical protein